MAVGEWMPVMGVGAGGEGTGVIFLKKSQLTSQVNGDGGGGGLRGVGVGSGASEASTQVSAGQREEDQLILDGAC